MCFVGDGGKGDSQDDEQQGRRAKQTSHSVSPRMQTGSEVANGPGGSASPESTKRHKNSVIIASPFITSEVLVGLAVTLFSLSPKRALDSIAALSALGSPALGSRNRL